MSNLIIEGTPIVNIEQIKKKLAELPILIIVWQSQWFSYYLNEHDIDQICLLFQQKSKLGRMNSTHSPNEVEPLPNRSKPNENNL